MLIAESVGEAEYSNNDVTSHDTSDANMATAKIKLAFSDNHLRDRGKF